jgi:hypothetical protein
MVPPNNGVRNLFPRAASGLESVPAATIFSTAPTEVLFHQPVSDSRLPAGTPPALRFLARYTMSRLDDVVGIPRFGYVGRKFTDLYTDRPNFTYNHLSSISEITVGMTVPSGGAEVQAILAAEPPVLTIEYLRCVA